MKKKFLSLVLVLSMLCAFAPIIASAETGTQYGDYLYYQVNDDNTAVTITDCDTSATEIVIPSEINGLPVTSIGIWTFQACTNLESIEIPDSITSIGDYAFSYCSSLTSIVIPNSVTNIGYYAFLSCSALENITIGSGVTSIDAAAFHYCSSLTNIDVSSNNSTYSSLDGVLFNKDKTELIYCPEGKSGSYTIPDSVTSIDHWAFFLCRSLTNIDVSSNNSTYSSSDGVVFNKDKTELILCLGGKSGSYTIPDSVTSIGDYAFVDCSSLTGIEISDSVTSIGEGAFEGCSSLTSIVIPNSVTSIGDWAFAECSSLTSIEISDSVTSIGEGAFFVCDSLTDVYYGGSKEEWNDISIGDYNDELLNANIHYNSAMPMQTTAPTTAPTPTPVPTPAPTPPPTTTAEITMSETDTTWDFDVSPEQAYEDCYVYAAVYDENGILLSLSRIPLDMTGNTSISAEKTDNASLAKVFVWADTLQPIIEAMEFDLTE